MLLIVFKGQQRIFYFSELTAVNLSLLQGEQSLNIRLSFTVIKTRVTNFVAVLSLFVI